MIVKDRERETDSDRDCAREVLRSKAQRWKDAKARHAEQTQRLGQTDGSQSDTMCEDMQREMQSWPKAGRHSNSRAERQSVSERVSEKNRARSQPLPLAVLLPLLLVLQLIVSWCVFAVAPTTFSVATCYW